MANLFAPQISPPPTGLPPVPPPPPQPLGTSAPLFPIAPPPAIQPAAQQAAAQAAAAAAAAQGRPAFQPAFQPAQPSIAKVWGHVSSGHSVTDRPTLLVVCLVRLVRVLVLWIAFYFVDRVYQTRFVERTLVNRDDPPKLWTLPLMAFAVEAAAFALLLGILFLLFARFKTSANSFVIDGSLLARILQEYVVTTVLSLASCGLVGKAAENKTLFRYKDDGLRAVRSTSLLMFLISTVYVSQLFSVVDIARMFSG